jgi:hypothetical protein
MTAEVIDLTDYAAKRQFGFTPRSSTMMREALARSELAEWASKYQDLDAHFMAECGTDLLMLADKLR